MSQVRFLPGVFALSCSRRENDFTTGIRAPFNLYSFQVYILQVIPAKEVRGAALATMLLPSNSQPIFQGEMSNPRRIHCFSGLGADHRLFNNLALPGFDLCPVQWLVPEPSESIPDYTYRLASKIELSSDDIFLGVSFGGIICQELALIHKPARLIIVSSLTDSSQMPAVFRVINNRLTRFFLSGGPKRAAIPIVAWLNGITSSADREILVQMSKDTDPRFLRWGMQQLLCWKPSGAVDDLIHIHGTKDLMIPFRGVNPTHIIEGGSHFMIMNRSEEISRLIQTV